MNHDSAYKERGFSLVEILIAVSLFALVAISVALFAVDTFRFNYSLDMRVAATLYEQEIRNAVILMKTDRWSTIVANADGTPKHVDFVNNRYQIADGTDERNGVTVSFTIDPVYRDVNGQIVDVGGTEDVHTKVVNISTSWTDISGQVNTLTSNVYVNDWNVLRWTQTTQAEFLPGTFDFTYAEDLEGGEIRLQSVKYSDWCRPSLSLTAYDMPGQGVAKTISAIPGNAVMGTGQNASGLSLINTLIDSEDPPSVSVAGTIDGYKTNDVFVDPGYAYIATDNNQGEIRIFDISVAPYQNVGYFNSPGSTDADSVYVAGDVGYMTAWDKLYAFDLALRSGERPQIGNAVTLAGQGKNIYIAGDYLFVATSSVATQMQIIDISNPAAIVIVGQARLDASAGVDVYVDSVLQRAYVATANSANKPEVFIIDVSQMTGDRPVIATYDTGAMNPTGVVTVADGRAIVVGTGGQEYQVVDIDNEQSIFVCGGIEVDSGINSVASVVNDRGAAYSYIVTGDTSAELKLIKGGLGGGNEQGDGYAPSGTFVSPIYDTLSELTQFYYIDWTETIAANTDIQVQLRTGNDPALSDGVWFGPDGTGATYFVDALGTEIPLIAQNKRYVQYKLFLTSDTINTPILDLISISYQPG